MHWYDSIMHALLAEFDIDMHPDFSELKLRNILSKL